LSAGDSNFTASLKLDFMQNVMDHPITDSAVFTPAVLLDHWQSQRRLTRKVIMAFPEDSLLRYSIGGMRPFAEMVAELVGMAHHGMNGIVSGKWQSVGGEDHHGVPENAMNKDDLLTIWDELTDHINDLWPQISLERFKEVDKAFGMYEGENYSTLFYFVDNEIHHRAQGYVYLRSLGIEPPAFWDTV
jgi:uncharacterized damage-inducible protein DinB